MNDDSLQQDIDEARREDDAERAAMAALDKLCEELRQEESVSS